jgi:ParB-like chromosome segregation protein Spo0J
MTIRDYKSIPVKNLIKYALNSRTHSSEQIEKIVCSINEFGFIAARLPNSHFKG